MTLRAAPRRPRARWLEPPRPDPAAIDGLAQALSLPRAVCTLLAARGYTAADDAKAFLRPSLAQLHPAATMPDLPRAVERLRRAIGAGETVLVHGDYDVDGMCSTALMVRTLRALGGRAEPFIPDRLRDGYDLGEAGVAAARAAGAGVVLTCDCGTSAHAAAEALQEAGIDLIISDHHLPGGPLPPALAVLNPRRVDSTYPDVDLCAAGVAYKLALALVEATGGNTNVVQNQLDLVALATVADVAPLRGENRVLVRAGLRLMAETRNVGLRALLRASALDEKVLTAGRVGFILAPRLNALGRLAQALDGVRLLLAEDEGTAHALARRCEELNRDRQALDRRILEEALARAEALVAQGRTGLVLWGEGWHPGVIGIVASRVVEAMGRPAVLVAVEGGVGKGSGRSIPAFDLHGALAGCDDLLLKHGGHRAAAGLTLDAAQLPAFAERFDALARAALGADDLVPTMRVDLELPLHEVTDQLEAMLRHLEPFGVGNPGPVLVARGVRVARGPQRLGADGVKCWLDTPAGPLEAVGWGLGARGDALAAGRTLDVAFRLERNEFRGRSTLQATLLDLRD